jgi:hypothetical protein
MNDRKYLQRVVEIAANPTRRDLDSIGDERIARYDVVSEANAPLACAVIGAFLIPAVRTPVLVPTLYVILEERFPRRVEMPPGELAPQGDAA